MKQVKRREFLAKLAAGTGLAAIPASVYAWDINQQQELNVNIVAQQQGMAFYQYSSVDKSVIKNAKAVLKGTNRRAVIVQLPVQNSKFMQYLKSGNKQLQDLFGDFVFVFADRNVAKKEAMLSNSDQLTLCDASLKKLDSRTFIQLDYTSIQAFARSLKQFLYGKELEHVNQWLTDGRAAMTLSQRVELERAIVGLDAASYRQRRKAKQRIKQDIGLAVPLLVNSKFHPISIEQKENCRDLLNCSSCVETVGMNQLTMTVFDPSRSRYGCGMGHFNCYSTEFINSLKA